MYNCQAKSFNSVVGDGNQVKVITDYSVFIGFSICIDVLHL